MNCPDSCKEIIFLAGYQGWKMFDYNQKIFVTFGQSFYQKIKFFPNLTFLMLIINIANVFNAWHGLSFIRFLDLLSMFFRKFPKLNCYEKIQIILISNNRFLLINSKLKVSNL